MSGGPDVAMADRDCREKWMEALRQHEIRSRLKYDTVVLEAIPPTVEAIVWALQLQTSGRSRRQGRRGAPEAGGVAVLPLTHPYYDRIGRERLQRLLVNFLKWNRRVRYHPSFALFCSQILVVLKSERLSFYAIAAAYEHLQLDQYYMEADHPHEGGTEGGLADIPSSPEQHLQNDADRVWEDTKTIWPTIAAVFVRFESEGLFMALAKEWLRSLLVSCHDPKQQSFEHFLPLLHRLVMDCLLDKCDPGDPRRRLREIIVCVFGRHCQAFEKVGTQVELAKVVAKLRACIRVDAALLELIGMRLSPCRCQALHLVSMVPAGCVGGWLTGVTGASMLAIASPLLCFAVGTVGTVVGGISAVTLAFSMGTAEHQATMGDLAHAIGDDARLLSCYEAVGKREHAMKPCLESPHPQRTHPPPHRGHPHHAADAASAFL